MILSAALLLTLGAGEAMAQKRAFTIEDVYRSQYVGAPQLSPDGTRLVFTTTQQSLPAQSSKTNLVLMETGENGTTRNAGHKQSFTFCTPASGWFFQFWG